MISPGFAIANGTISSRECDELLERIATLPMGSGRAGARGLMAFEWVRSLAIDSRLTDLARRVSGRSLKPTKPHFLIKLRKRIGLLRGIRTLHFRSRSSSRAAAGARHRQRPVGCSPRRPHQFLRKSLPLGSTLTSQRPGMVRCVSCRGRTHLGSWTTRRFVNFYVVRVKSSVASVAVA